MIKLQGDIQEWLERNFPTITLEQKQLLLTEETGEMSRAILKMQQGIRGTREEWTNEVYKEMGDVLIALTHLANHFGFDLDEVFADRWGTIQQRDFIANPLQQGIEAS